MTRAVTIVVPGRPPNPNVARRYHWRTRHSTDQAWKALAVAAAQQALPVAWTPLTKARMSVVHVVPTKARRDPDNLAAGIKASLDGLVLGGVIADDSDRVLVSVSHTIEYVKGVTETRYTFEDASVDGERARAAARRDAA